MKPIIIALGVAVLVFAVSARPQTPAQTKAGTGEQEVLKLVQDWMDAEVKADMVFLDRFIAEDCVALRLRARQADLLKGRLWSRKAFSYPSSRQL